MKLAAWDRGTVDTVVAWAQEQLDRTGLDYVSIAASDGLGWDVDPGTGEHHKLPSQRIGRLAAAVADRTTGRPVVQAYGPSVPPPGAWHPDVVVVVAKQYMPDGWTVPSAIEAHHAAGARMVQPKVGWTDWYHGQPGGSILLLHADLAEVLSWPRYGSPDALHGATSAAWYALRPHLHALGVALQQSSPSVSSLHVSTCDYVAHVYGVAGEAAWFWHRLHATPGTPSGALWGALASAFAVADDAAAKALLGLVHHTAYLQCLELGDTDEALRWAWSCPLTLDTRAIAAHTRTPQGTPPAGFVPVDGVDNPDAMAALVRCPLEPS